MKTYKTLSALAEKDLVALIAKSAKSAFSANLELGKMVFLLRPEVGTVKAHIRTLTGTEVPDHAFCCAKSFELVDSGDVEEAIYDATPLKWHLQISAILNLLTPEDSAQRADIVAQIVAILTSKAEGAEKKLKALKASLKPTPTPAATGKGADEEPENVIPMPADLLSVSHLQALGFQIPGCTDSAKLTTALAAFRALLDMAESRLEDLAVSVAA